jgi:sugar-specific transcriptional regulator TrmB
MFSQLRRDLKNRLHIQENQLADQERKCMDYERKYVEYEEDNHVYTKMISETYARAMKKIRIMECMLVLLFSIILAILISM